ncbi:MAG: FAD-dependent oxidoreductase [Chloroflexi bacterium]|nr:FAD-dependent oxidoreductase [Chloroflexota bacterium]
MTTWHEYAQRNGSLPEWPYPIRYGEERVVQTDVLVLGGGIAGCHAAINARRSGARVVVLEKAATKWSGNGGAGVDHWLAACTNPSSEVSPEEFTAQAIRDSGGYDCGPLRYINAKDGWDTLLDCEQMGVQIRDVHDEFKGAAFRDDDSRLLFAYDYQAKMDLRVYGWNMKPSLHKEMKRLRVQILDRVMVTALLTEENDQGKRVIGAMGLHTRTGEFIIVQARATIYATGLPGRIWVFSTEHRPTFRDPNLACDGMAAVWNAGAEFTRLEETYPDGSPLSFIAYGVGNAHNTWHGCPIVDANGKEVPWVDRDGNELGSWQERFRPSLGQRYMVGHGQRIPPSYETHVKQLAPDLPERIRRGEFTLPLYADLSRLPETERRAIFGLMVGNEGRTRVPVYEALTKAGFDPDRDMLQVPVLGPDSYRHANAWAGSHVPYWRQWGCGGVIVDWDLRTSLEGLYAAGGAIYGAGAHSSAAASGRYAGRKAAAYALAAPEVRVDSRQVQREKARVYAPLETQQRSIGWKELNAGVARVMQTYCGEFKSGAALQEGLRILGEIRETEAAATYAANPHDLAHVVECLSIITAGEAVIQASLARKASSALLSFSRLDYPDVDPAEWHKLLSIKSVDGKASIGELPLDYYLRPPFAPTFEENYALHQEH